jgi:3-phosphoglycerate kinase
MEHTSLNEIRDTIVAELRAAGYDETKAEILLKNANGDASLLPSIFNSLVAEKVDLLIPIATPSAQAAAAATSDIPIVFSAVSNPIDAGLVTALDVTDKNITGVSNAIAIEDIFGLAKELMETAGKKGVKLLLPVDTVIADKFAADANYKTVPADKIPDGWMGMDIGEESRKLFSDEIKKAKTVIWNGPMGVFEFDVFAKGTEALAEACANCGGTTIIGGGDSASAVKKLGYSKKMTHISTGGGASLEFMEGKVLPGVAALNDK